MTDERSTDPIPGVETELNGSTPSDRPRLDGVVGGAVALQPFNGHELIGPVSVADLALGVAAVAVVATQVRADEGWLAAGLRPVGVPTAALAGWLALVGGGWKLTQFGAILLLLGIVGAYARSIGDLETLLWGALAGATAVAALTLLSILVAPEFGGRVAGSRGIGPLPELPRTVGVPIGSFGAWATYVLAPLGFAVLRWRRTRARWLLGSIGPIVGAVVLQQTRATYLALAVLGAVVVVGLYGRRIRDAAWRNAGASVLALCIGGVALSGAAWRLYRVNPANALTRLAQFERAVALIAANPALGVTSPVIQHFPETDTIPHNVVLLVGVVGGLPAVGLLALALAGSVAGLWRCARASDPRVQSVGLGGGAGLAATLTSLSLAPGFTRAFWLLVAVGGLLVVRSGHRLTGLAWPAAALSNSRTAPACRVVGRLLADALRTDATGLRDRLAAAVRRSVSRRAVRTARRLLADSALTRLLVGR